MRFFSPIDERMDLRDLSPSFTLLQPRASAAFFTSQARPDPDHGRRAISRDPGPGVCSSVCVCMGVVGLPSSGCQLTYPALQHGTSSLAGAYEPAPSALSYVPRPPSALFPAAARHACSPTVVATDAPGSLDQLAQHLAQDVGAARDRLGRHTPAAFISRTGVVEVGALQEEHRASMPWSTLGPRPPLPCRTTAP